MTLNDPPRLSEIEVSLFGPGLGEAIAIHLGQTKWMVVDSCKNPASERSATLEYLEGIGVDCSEDVLLVVSTHGHDDHIGGLGELLDACDNARFACPSAMTTDQFFSLLAVDARLEGLRRSVYGEFRQIDSILKRRQRKPNRIGRYLYGFEGRPLLAIPETASSPQIKVVAVTPSDTALTRSLETLASMYPETDEKQPLKDLPNEVALALWIEVGETRILLGSDVEVGTADCGWKGVLAWPDRPTETAQVFKVAHHGGKSGHHQPMWDEMLSKPISILTPFVRGSNSLPTDDDLQRIAQLSSKTLISSFPKRAQPKGQVRQAAASLGGVVTNVQVQPQGMGQVRLRREIAANSQWRFDVDPPALEILKSGPAQPKTRNKSKRRSEKRRGIT
jgi:hypothetical protein